MFRLGRDLALELARAHAEAPPRFPSIDPAAVAMEDGRPRVTGGGPKGRPAEGLVELGALLHWLATGEKAGRELAPGRSSARRSQHAPAPRGPAHPGLAPRRRDTRPSAAAAATALERALLPEAEGPSPWPLFRGATTRAGAFALDKGSGADAKGAAAPPAGLGSAWQSLVGAVVASPLLTRDLVVVGSADGRLFVLDRETGARVHEAKLASALEASPALHGRAILLGTDDGELLAVDVLRRPHPLSRAPGRDGALVAPARGRPRVRGRGRGQGPGLAPGPGGRDRQGRVEAQARPRVLVPRARGRPRARGQRRRAPARGRRDRRASRPGRCP